MRYVIVIVIVLFFTSVYNLFAHQDLKAINLELLPKAMHMNSSYLEYRIASEHRLLTMALYAYVNKAIDKKALERAWKKFYAVHNKYSKVNVKCSKLYQTLSKVNADLTKGKNFLNVVKKTADGWPKCEL